jgi:hypothetical protein
MPLLNLLLLPLLLPAAILQFEAACVGDDNDSTEVGVGIVGLTKCVGSCSNAS